MVFSAGCMVGVSRGCHGSVVALGWLNFSFALLGALTFSTLMKYSEGSNYVVIVLVSIIIVLVSLVSVTTSKCTLENGEDSTPMKYPKYQLQSRFFLQERVQNFGQIRLRFVKVWFSNDLDRSFRDQFLKTHYSNNTVHTARDKQCTKQEAKWIFSPLVARCFVVWMRPQPVVILRLQAFRTPLVFLFWTLFQESPFQWNPHLALSTYLAILAICVMIPAVIIYNTGYVLGIHF